MNQNIVIFYFLVSIEELLSFYLGPCLRDNLMNPPCLADKANKLEPGKVEWPSSKIGNDCKPGVLLPGLWPSDLYSYTHILFYVITAKD